MLASENQDAIEAASEHSSPEAEREDTAEELGGQDGREQGEGGAALVDGAWEEQNSEEQNSEEQNPERDNEEEPQAQSFDKATTSERIHQRNSVTRGRPSTASAASGKLKKKRITNKVQCE